MSAIGSVPETDPTAPSLLELISVELHYISEYANQLILSHAHAGVHDLHDHFMPTSHTSLEGKHPHRAALRSELDRV